MKNIFLDHASTTPVDKKVLAEMKRFWCDDFGNPGSIHKKGVEAKKAIEEARKKVAEIFNVMPREIFFTGGGTESNNLAILGTFGTLIQNQLLTFSHSQECQNVSNSRAHVITTVFEHPSVLEPIRELEKRGAKVSYVKPEENGIVEPKKIREALREDTKLVSVMYANNEIGTIQPIKEISKIIRRFKKDMGRKPEDYPYLHTDACQAPGLLSVNLEKLGVGMASFSGQKMYGPKGIGLLYVNRGIMRNGRRNNAEGLTPLFYGGGQEQGLWPGTEPVSLIVGFSKALELVEKNKEKEITRLVELRNYFIKKVLDKIPDTVLNGDPTERLPNAINFSFLGVPGELAVIELDNKGVFASTGSACTSDDPGPSKVVLTLGDDFKQRAESSVRFFLGKNTTKRDLNYAIKILPEIIKRHRSISLKV